MRARARDRPRRRPRVVLPVPPRIRSRTRAPPSQRPRSPARTNRASSSLPEENDRHEREGGNQHRQRIPQDVAEKRRHRNPGLLGDRLDHEVRRVADVGIGPHEDRSGGYRLQEGVVLANQCGDRLAFGHARIEPAERGREERQIRRRVVEERREKTARPEEVRRLADGTDDERERAVLAGTQHRERGNDRREYPAEQDRDFPNRLPRVPVFLTYRPRGREPRREQETEKDDVAHDVLHLLAHAEDRDFAEIVRARVDHGGQDAAEKEEIVPAVDADRLRRTFRARAEPGILASPEDHVDDDVRAEHAQRGEEHLAPERERPEERYAVQEAEEERRITERRQRTTDVGDEEDEEDDGVRAMAAPTVRTQERTDEQHRGTGGPDPRREHGPDRHERGVHARCPAQAAADVDPTADREERAEQDDEGHVVDDRDVRELVEGGPPERRDERHDEHGGPSGRDLRIVMVPEDGREEREERDREQHPREGDGTPDGEKRAQLSRHGA